MIHHSNKYYGVSNIQQLLFFILGILPWFGMTVILYPRLWYAADNLRMIEVAPLGRDEGFLGGNLWGGWQTGAPIFFSNYGFLYNNIFWGVTKILSLMLPITQHFSIVLLRGINLIIYLSIGMVSYFYLRQKQGISFAIIYSLLLFLVSKDQDFILRTTSIQTDLLNFFTILLFFFSILHLRDKFSFRRLMLASFCVGMVMAVKFFGLLLIPLLTLTLILIAFDKQTHLNYNIKIMARILKRAFLLILGALAIIIMEEIIFPTRSFTEEIIGISKINHLYIFQLFLVSIVCVIITTLILKLFQFCASQKSTRDWFKKITFIWSTVILSFLIFSLSFALLSSKSLFRFNFIKDLLLHGSQQPYFHSVVSGKVNTIFKEGLGILLSILFLLGSFTIFLKLIAGRSLSNKKYLYIPLLWSLLILFFFIFIVKGFELRHIYLLYPAAIYIAADLVVDIFRFINKHQLLDRKLSNSFSVIFILIILVMSAKIIKLQASITKTQYSCLECLPGVKAGRWLDRNFPINQTKIIQETSVYIPERFSDPRFFPWGDPYPPYKSYNPDIIFLKGAHVRNVFSLKENDTELTYRVVAAKPKRFLSDLYFHRLPYRKSIIFGSEKDGNDIIAFIKDSIQTK